jgi:hypothetical protein
LTNILITVILVCAGFLCVLNAALAIAFRRRQAREVLCYIAAGLIELAIFAVVLALRVGILKSIPFHLPPGLSFNRAEIGAPLTLGIGLFPAAYWHRTSLSQLRARMARDAQVMHERDGGVRIKAPGE